MALILASASAARLQMLHAAGLEVASHPVRIDEPAVRDALLAEGAKPRDIADALAEMKARKAADRFPADLVLGCDQLLDLDGTLFSKPESADAARTQLAALRGRTHRLHAALVVYQGAKPVWRHVGEARLTMRSVSDAYLDTYVTRNWPGIGQSVGAYKIEEEGIRLFSAIEGDHFTILGLPLIPLLGWLGLRGVIPA